MVEKADGLEEEDTHLGLTVVDNEGWQVVARPDLPLQFIRDSGDVVIGVNTVSTTTWTEDIYVISMDDTGSLAYAGPFTTVGGGCSSFGNSRLLCFGYSGQVGTRSVVDISTGDVLTELEFGDNDDLLENGVLIDRR